MKKLGWIIIGIVVLLAIIVGIIYAFTNGRICCGPKDLCKDELSDYGASVCYQQLAIKNSDISICSNIESPSSGDGPIFSSTGCRNYVYNALAQERNDSSYCEKIIETTDKARYTLREIGVHTGTRIDNFEYFKTQCFEKLLGCAGEGEVADFNPDPTESRECCEGLKEYAPANALTDDCDLVGEGFGTICINCGDGICGEGENECNCEEDCEEEIINCENIINDSLKFNCYINYSQLVFGELQPPEEVKHKTGVIKELNTRIKLDLFNLSKGEVILFNLDEELIIPFKYSYFAKNYHCAFDDCYKFWGNWIYPNSTKEYEEKDPPISVWFRDDLGNIAISGNTPFEIIEEYTGEKNIFYSFSGSTLNFSEKNTLDANIIINKVNDSLFPACGETGCY